MTVARSGSRGGSGSGCRRRRHRVGDDVHVGRAPAPQPDLVALARRQRDEGVDVARASEHARVARGERPVPAPGRRPQVQVVHLVEQAHARVAERREVGQDVARVGEHEDALVLRRELAQPSPVPRAQVRELAADPAAGTDPEDRLGPRPRAGVLVRGDAEVRRAVGPQVVVDLAPGRGRAVHDAQHAAVLARLLLDDVRGEVGQRVAGRLVAPAVLAVVVVQVAGADRLAQRALLEQPRAPAPGVGHRAEREHLLRAAPRSARIRARISIARVCPPASGRIW